MQVKVMSQTVACALETLKRDVYQDDKQVFTLTALISQLNCDGIIIAPYRSSMDDGFKVSLYHNSVIGVYSVCIVA